MKLHFNVINPLRPKLTEEDWGKTEWVVDDSLVPGVGISVAAMTISKGKTSPLHVHSNCHELIYLVEGKVEITLDKERLILNEGDSVLCPSGKAHRYKNLGATEARLVVSYSTGKRKYEAL